MAPACQPACPSSLVTSDSIKHPQGCLDPDVCLAGTLAAWSLAACISAYICLLTNQLLLQDARTKSA